MSKYIDVSTLTKDLRWNYHNFDEEIKSRDCNTDYLTGFQRGLSAAYTIIRRQPSADVEEVVRCKDCKHCDKIDEHEFWCLGRGFPETMVRPYEFCSRGERKETNG